MAKGRVTFKEERCKGCGLCTAACPQGIIELSRGLNSMGYHPAVVTDADNCKGCALCALVCPDVVIEVEKEDS